MINNNSTKVQKSLDTAQQTNKNGSETVVYDINIEKINKLLKDCSESEIKKILRLIHNKDIFFNSKLGYTLHDFVRIGTGYFLRAKEQDIYGSYYTLQSWNKETIKDDFGTKAIPKPYLNLPKYIGFTNKPNNVEYQRNVNGFYNQYEPLNHEIKQGSLKYMENFLSHISQGKASLKQDIQGDNFTILLDYLTILYQKPTQILPILVLYSKARSTGKTTFLELVKAIFQSNAIIANNESFQNTFNGHIVTKLFIGIDEAFQNSEKRSQIERIKQMSTANKMPLELKGVDTKEVDFFGKIAMTTNSLRNLWIDKEEIRYFILEVPKVVSKESKAVFKKKLFSEIPHFLHFIQNRKICHQNLERHWFANHLLDNELLRQVKEFSKPDYVTEFEEFMSEAFEVFEVDTLEYTRENLYLQIKETYPKIDKNKLAKYLKDNDYEYLDKNHWYHYYRLDNYKSDSNNTDIHKQYKQGRTFKFYKKDFFNPSIVVSENQNLELEKVQKKEYEATQKVLDQYFKFPKT